MSTPKKSTRTSNTQIMHALNTLAGTLDALPEEFANAVVKALAQAQEEPAPAPKAQAKKSRKARKASALTPESKQSLTMTFAKTPKGTTKPTVKPHNNAPTSDGRIAGQVAGWDVNGDWVSYTHVDPVANRQMACMKAGCGQARSKRSHACKNAHKFGRHTS
jgi:hypothetical protein